MTIEFHTLGAVRLTRDGTELEGVLAQPKRLALLTYLALARPRGFRARDELLLLFWPESNEKKARASLRTALHFLRQSLGRDAILSRGSNQVALDADTVWCDARAFEAAMEEDRLEGAMELYHGPLLGNVRAEGSPEWETWLDAERARLAALAREACWTLATRAAAGGDAAEVERWGLAAVEHAPEDEDAVRRLMSLLDQSGRRTAALAAFDRLRVALEDLGYEPEPGTVQLAERIRSTPPPDVREERRPREIDPIETAAPEATFPAPEEEQRSEPTPDRRRTSGTVLRWAVGAVVAALVLAGVFLLADRASRPGNEDPGVIDRAPGLAVFPFVVRGTEDRYGLGDGIVDLLSASLDGFDSWRTIDPRAVYGVAGEDPGDIDPETGDRLAERLRARYYILGSVVGEGSRLRVTAGLYDREAGPAPVATARTEGSGDEIFRLVDRIAAELAAQGTGEPRHLDQAAASATESLEALRLYLSGTSAFRKGAFDEAVNHLHRAVLADTTFALAAYQLRLAGEAAGAYPELIALADRVMTTHLDHLPERVRQLAEARMTYLYEGPFAAEGAYRGILERRPEEVEAWYQLADIQFHYHPLRGQSFTTSRAAFERVLEFEPEHLEAILHLARIAAWERDRSRLDELTRRGLSGIHQGDVRLELLALRGVVLEDREALDGVLDELQRTGDGRVWIVAVRTAVYSSMPDASRDLFTALLAPTRPAEARAMAHIAFAHLALAEGRAGEAAGELDAAEELSPGTAAPFRLWLATFPFLTGRCETVDALPAPSLEAVTGRPLPELTTMNPARRGALALPLPDEVVEALLDACHGRFTPALAAAARVEGRDYYGPRYAESIRRHVAWAGGLHPTEEVLRPPTETSAFAPQARPVWILGEIDLREGRFEAALGWYRGVVRDLEIGSLPYYGPAELRKAEALDRLGRLDEARRRYQRFVELWKDADPELRSLVDRARRRLSEMEG